MKKGQFQISFGMIFSIIIIIATIGVAVYVIVNFVNLGKNVSCKLYYDDLQKKIDAAWYSQGSVRELFNGNPPGGVESVCFGTFNQSVIDAVDSNKFEDFKFYGKKESNMFFFPNEVCNDQTFGFTLKHVTTDGFFCIDETSGKMPVRIVKGNFDSLVKLTK